jgi:predicted deacylase
MHIELNYLHSRNGGIMKLCKRENELFEEGETLCVIDDLFGNRVEALNAPWPGVVIGYWSVPVVHPGDWCSLAAKIIDAPKF